MRWLIAVLVVCICVPSLSAQTIYGLKSRSNNTGGSGEYLTPATLFRFDDDGSQFYAISPVTKDAAQIRADGLAYSSTLGLWCFELTSTSVSTLYQLDPATASVISPGIVLAGRQIFGAAFDRRDRLWAIDETDDELLTIDIASGTVTRHISLTLDARPFDFNSASGDICFNAMGKAFIVDYDAIYELNVRTGVLTELYTNTTTNPKFLVGAAVPNDSPDTLITFDVTKTSVDNDDIFVYNLKTFSDPDYIFKAILTDFNAGRGDLAAAVPADLTVSSSFENDEEGWTGAALSTTNLSLVEAFLPLNYDAEGHIGITDNDNAWTTFAAPPAFLGDKSHWLGGQISLEMQSLTGGTRIPGPVLFLVSDGIVLCSPWILLSDAWQLYSVQLTPEGWHTGTYNGPEPSLELMLRVLANLDALYIVGDFVAGVETTHIDNVQLLSGLSADSDASGFVNLVDFARFAAQWSQTGCSLYGWCDGQDFNKSGDVNLNDLAYLVLHWLSEMY